ncbi:hypothetical protein [Niastella populi]|uniref:Lipocalin-like domain-containing protein n=1 Tax=Niastella populi TaxID=550983 RepID=A0A1V9EGI1_9BACT|nr:hypothetical protein [Niastella populi]OQP45249.1 hypothetical protein A4R26_32385 [Niastella populi]
MRKWYQLLLLVALVLAAASCQKEISGDITPPAGGPLPSDTTPPGLNTEVGSWMFVSLTGKIDQTAEFSQSGASVKAVSSSNFISTNNDGTVTFDNSTMTANAITLAVNTTATTSIYMNGVLFDTEQTPFSQTLPPQNASSNYTKIGTDSLHFQDGGFLNAITGGLLPNIPTGCKLKFESSNVMKMITVYDTVTTQAFQGIPAKITLRAELVATLRKN